MPQSLFGRLMVALVGVVGITLLIVVALIVRERRDLALLGTGAWSTAQIIAETSIELAGLGGADREAAVQKYLDTPISVDLDRPRPPRRQDSIRIARAFANRIQRELGDEYRVVVMPARPTRQPVIRIGGEARRDGPGPGPDFGPRMNPRFAGMLAARFLDVNVALPDGRELVFRTAAPQPGPPLPTQIFIELGLVTCILGFVLWFMTRSITRPLSDLARAAETVGRGAKPVPLVERGAKEVRNATRAFNTMQERLQRYLDSRTRVLAAMSHDLRTPLTRLRLRAESIDNPDVRARFTADLDEMNGMVKGALSLFRDMNDDEAFEPVDVGALLHQLQTEFAETGGEISIEGDAASLPARPKALKRCLMNLLGNAIKYGARARVFVSDGSEVTVRIQDDGSGIPNEYLEQVFEPFFRVEASRNRDTGGTGLGLCIARDIVQAHGGEIGLANLPGGGLEATVVLPRITES